MTAPIIPKPTARDVMEDLSERPVAGLADVSSADLLRELAKRDVLRVLSVDKQVDRLVWAASDDHRKTAIARAYGAHAADQMMDHVVTCAQALMRTSETTMDFRYSLMVVPYNKELFK